MYVRLLQQQEIKQASTMAWKSFRATVAASCSPEGRETFRKYIQYENIADSWFRGETILLGCFEGQQMKGMAGLNRNGHIAFLYADPKALGRGIERQLLEEISRIAVQQLGVYKVTTNVPSSLKNIYLDLGLQQVAAEQSRGGVCFYPMELILDQVQTPISDSQPEPYHYNINYQIKEHTVKNNSKSIWITLLAICGIGLILLGGLGIWSFARYSARWEPSYVDSYIFGYDFWDYDYDYHEHLHRGGLHDIAIYIGSDITYSIEQQNYYLLEEIGTILLYFDVNFPMVMGLQGGTEVEVNQTIRDAAMENVNYIYLHPSESMIEDTLTMIDPYFSSFVTYAITYMDNDFISVAFEDTYNLGDHEFFLELRTVNINLTDGTTYQIDDVITVEDEFMEIWLEKMRQEAPHAVILDEIPISEFKNILQGNNSAFREAFMVTGNGIEIGFSYRHGNTIGWITAPFTMDEIMLYQTDSDFWDIINTDLY